MILKKERQRRKAGEAAPELMQEGAKVFRELFFSGTAGWWKGGEEIIFFLLACEEIDEIRWNRLDAGGRHGYFCILLKNCFEGEKKMFTIGWNLIDTNSLLSIQSWHVE